MSLTLVLPIIRCAAREEGADPVCQITHERPVFVMRLPQQRLRLGQPRREGVVLPLLINQHGQAPINVFAVAADALGGSLVVFQERSARFNQHFRPRQPTVWAELALPYKLLMAAIGRVTHFPSSSLARKARTLIWWSSQAGPS